MAIADPYANFSFLVEIDGIVRAGFHEVSGVDSSIDVIEHQEGNDTVTRKYPGRVKYSNIVLRWGLADDTDLYQWHQQWVTGDPAAKRKTGSIVLQDRRGKTELARWNFTNAWPCRYTAPSLNAEGNDIAIETLELAHEGVERA
ncbi:MAG: phage tail protein [Proteobacteria bacterium]|nr:phage tail protein [Pseudomonadota bacterium]